MITPTNKPTGDTMKLFQVNGQSVIFNHKGEQIVTKHISTKFGVEHIAIDQVKNHNNKLASCLLPPDVLAIWQQDKTKTVFTMNGKTSAKPYYALVSASNIIHLN